jgi:magnesium chelatase family protein
MTLKERDMFSRVKSFVLNGLDCREIEIEADKAGGMHNFTLVGLPDAAVRESKERVGSAIKNSGFKPPYHFGRITVSLAPSYLKKTGCGLDLAIAISILEATQQISSLKEKSIYLGELSLDGYLRETQGVLPITIAAKEAGYDKIFVPVANAREANLIKGITVISLRSLKDYFTYLKGESQYLKNNFFKSIPKISKKKQEFFKVDFADIKGQEKAKRALLVIAAGGHNLLFTGSPGTGKTFLARAIPSILPRLSLEEQLEVTKIYSIAGLLPKEEPLIATKPFRSPHHTASDVALVGGGSKINPGEITLAHRGVLFLDEILEFSRKALDSLRQPLEDGIINISRASGSVVFPAKFILVGAMNPCPCGYLNDPDRACTCSASAIAKYKQRLSGPIIDRIDIFIEIRRVKYQKLKSNRKERASKSIRKIVEAARKIQLERFEKDKIFTNSEMGSKEVEKYCILDNQSRSFLKKAVETYYLSTRSYYRILKVARTIADLENEEKIKREHIAEAVQYQMKNLQD